MNDSEPLSLPRTDVEVILGVARKVRCFERGVITAHELVYSMLTHLAGVQADHGIEQAAARLPNSVHNILVECLSEIGEMENPGQLFIFRPFEPTSAELEVLNARALHVTSLLQRFADSPVARRDIVEMPYDAKSEILSHLVTVPGTSCREEGCNFPRVRFSVYCPDHHYDMLKKLDASSE